MVKIKLKTNYTKHFTFWCDVTSHTVSTTIVFTRLHRQGNHNAFPPIGLIGLYNGFAL
ncbi:Uncharacterised protein [Vibrio cholerae]|nr:Uncharacterised protein [Vibrio cholerae]CSI52172.1 Uncharacterised protein [Vibrio cholerae]CSI57293.1 Uncharacterised protein [Vibrio cholerae]